MENCRGRHTYSQHKVRGVALVSALITGIMVALAIAGLYYILMRTIGTVERVRTYASVRDAAVGGVNYAISQIKSGIFNSLLRGECPDGIQNNCCSFSISYRLQGTTDTFSNDVTLCLVGYTQPPGEQATGVAYSKPSSAGAGYVFSIISVGRGPQGSASRMEAIYVK